MRVATTPAPDCDEAPAVGSFTVAARFWMTTAGTTARVSVALPEDVKATPTTLVPALLSLGQQVLIDYRLTGHELPDRTETVDPPFNRDRKVMALHSAGDSSPPAYAVHSGSTGGAGQAPRVVVSR
ncbi:hypothetical protein ACFYE2_17295 [Kocuria sp. CPCC 205300]|uniref:hypothetical protein n=1 Tax=Kocuria sabuli TaxID=3071448 RepID=UPI0036DCEB29